MRATWRLPLTLSVLAVAVSACSSGSTGGSGTTTVTTTVTTTSSSATMSPPHVVATPSAGSGTTGTATTGTGTPRCDGPTLAVTVGPGGGAAGTIYYRVVFTNRGSAACSLQGFPGVAAADSAGTAKVDATRDTSSAATRVVLAAGRAAHADLAVRNVPPSSAACPTYPLLLVTPPDSRRTSTISRTVQPCANEMRITPVRAGAS